MIWRALNIYTLPAHCYIQRHKRTQTVIQQSFTRCRILYHSVQQGSDQGRTSSATAPHSFAQTYVFPHVSPSHACLLRCNSTYSMQFHLIMRMDIKSAQHYFPIHRKQSYPFYIYTLQFDSGLLPAYVIGL